MVWQLMTDPAPPCACALDAACLCVATFFVEPVSVKVRRYAHEHITDSFVNYCRATWHGAIVAGIRGVRPERFPTMSPVALQPLVS